MGRVKVNLTIDADLSREKAIAEEAREARNRRWREDNRDALAAYAEEVERKGLPLARFRSF